MNSLRSGTAGNTRINNMILTATLNPSLDIAYLIKDFRLDTVNRVLEIQKTPGGKGLNVTRVLSQLNEPVLVTGLLGGKLGEYMQERLDDAGVRHDFHKIKGETRNCIAILHDGMQTELLEAGPVISEEEYQGFLKHFETIIKEADTVVFSGSLPTGIDSSCYAELTALCGKENIPVVLDCSGEALEKALQAEVKPAVIKPNTEELGQLLSKEISKDNESLKACLNEDIFKGVEWIVVSLGKDGCFANHNDKFWRVSIPTIKVVSPVGSGDSTVAGIASGLENGYDDEKLLKHANTLGMLNAMEKKTGFVNMANYDMLFEQITVTEV